jgi:hypothetical protein
VRTISSASVGATHASKALAGNDSVASKSHEAVKAIAMHVANMKGIGDAWFMHWVNAGRGPQAY